MNPGHCASDRAVLDEHREIWSRKPILGRVYAVWFDLLLEPLPQGSHVLELGAGPGWFAPYARRQRPDLRWLASDLLAAPWNDLAADAGRLPVRNGSLDAILGLDVIHHLERPGRLFEEAARALRPGGRLAFIEPWVTPFSYPIYRFLHHEGCRLGLDPLDPFAASRGHKQAFEGDAAVVWRLCRRLGPGDWTALGFEPPRLRKLNGFAYLLSLGFRPASLLPERLAPVVLELDRLTGLAAACLGLRALVSWERTSQGWKS